MQLAFVLVEELEWKERIGRGFGHTLTPSISHVRSIYSDVGEMQCAQAGHVVNWQSGADIWQNGLFLDEQGQIFSFQRGLCCAIFGCKTSFLLK